jgi:hypothetical protein
VQSCLALVAVENSDFARWGHLSPLPFAKREKKAAHVSGRFYFHFGAPRWARSISSTPVSSFETTAGIGGMMSFLLLAPCLIFSRLPMMPFNRCGENIFGLQT